MEATDSGGPAFRLGTALVSLVDVPIERAAAYHRWYERDHFYPGMLAGPHCFSGRRWIAPRPLRELSGVLGRGLFLNTYWIEAGTHDAFMDWARTAYERLRAQGRLFDGVEHVDTSFHSFTGWEARDPDGVPPELALDHPFAGLVMVRGGRPPEPEGPVALRVSFTPMASVGFTTDPAPLHLLFLDREPAEAWPTLAATLSGTDRAAAFVPTVPGTDRHLGGL